MLPIAKLARPILVDGAKTFIQMYRRIRERLLLVWLQMLSSNITSFIFISFYLNSSTSACTNVWEQCLELLAPVAGPEGPEGHRKVTKLGFMEGKEQKA